MDIPLVSLRDEFALFESRLNLLHRDKPLQILEAGCGRHWPLKLKVPYELTGIDTDDDSLAIRQNTCGDLKRAVCGDLARVEFEEAEFDAIYCSFVLEHVREADRVLANFARWLKPGGLLILRVPDRRSVYGFVTRMTPHWVHVLYRRHVAGFKEAGKDGHGPYPTVYHPAISLNGIRYFCMRYGMRLDIARSGHYLRKRLARYLAVTVSALSFGLLAWRHNNYTFIAEKD